MSINMLSVLCAPAQANQAHTMPTWIPDSHISLRVSPEPDTGRPGLGRHWLTGTDIETIEPINLNSHIKQLETLNLSKTTGLFLKNLKPRNGLNFANHLGKHRLFHA